jgi:hypothetical protein
MKLLLPVGPKTHFVTVSESAELVELHDHQTFVRGLSVDITSPTPNQILNTATVTVTATVTGGPTGVTAWLSPNNGQPLAYNSSSHDPATTTWSFTWNNVANGNYLATVQAKAGGETAYQSVPFGVQHA